MRYLTQRGEAQPKAFTAEGAEDAEVTKVVDVYGKPRMTRIARIRRLVKAQKRPQKFFAAGDEFDG
ncbi:MAG: hypothetical protein DMG65_15465 [Candidatus Angelobacter sp. Gp1-AA117]|nr:MAG: hypothetical protein DMG65_15465 [Candidatus Angelobacter sp. Gp1-AA117]